MNISKKVLLFLMMLFSSGACSAQTSDVGTWFQYFGNQAIDKKWNWGTEIQYRNYNFIGDLQQLLFKTGIGYNLTENNNNVFLGYGFINTQTYPPHSTDKEAKISTNEHRIYEQFLTQQNFGIVYMRHRYRIEERFFDNSFRIRFRYQLSFNVPITAKTMSEHAIYLLASDEIFINTETPVFDRNRLAGGVGYVVSKYFKVEAGFLAQATALGNRNQFTIAVHNSLPFKHKDGQGK